MHRRILVKFQLVSLAFLSLAAGALAQGSHKMDMSRYGGPAYMGKPALAVTSSFVAAGGGAAKFSTAKALVSMLGESTVSAEVAKLAKQYGKARVDKWLAMFDFAVADALRIATKAKVKLPVPALSGPDLALTMVKAAMDKDGTVYTEFLLDKALSHAIHEAVMDNMDKKFGPADDLDFHRITNQALYDVAVALKVKGAKLAKLH
jgi:malonyl CoA-acyl carrier protein transacylase